jgi:two-component system, NarL family, nitrate/nitrite sensor histidine kinase NarX
VKRSFSANQPRNRWLRFFVFLAVLLLGLGIDALSDQRIVTPIAGPLIVVLVILLAGICYWMADNWFSVVNAQLGMQGRIELAESSLSDMQKRLTAVIQVNNHLADTTDEQSLMKSVLELIGGLAGAVGSSYIPLDELGQPLAVVHQGEVPQAVFERWLSHLSDPDIQDECRDCKLGKSSLSAKCPLQDQELFSNSDLSCLPVRRGERVLGMVNLYMGGKGEPAEDLISFLTSLLSEVALAVETFRLRDQEVATMRELQLVRSPRMDIAGLIKGLIDEVQHALETDYAMLWSSGSGPRQSQIFLGTENSALMDTPEVRAILQAAGTNPEIISFSCETEGTRLPEGLGAMLVAPLVIPETGVLIGAIVVGNCESQPFYPRQLRVMRTIAEQAALLIERERLIDELEYRSVIDERSRLAREIHDGLAQTLAFLKLQSSQMQTMLARGDLKRLDELLQTNYRTLSAAYLDTRQAIDNLRVTPREKIEDWLSQTVKDFEESTGINCQLVIQPGTIDLPFEIQAQLIRVVQESLSNIRKHARAKHVLVSVRHWKEDVILEVTDDGEGFSPEDVPGISQYGLRGMRERAELIGADFQIVSSPDQGTSVRLRLPYRIEETPV